MVRRFGKRRSTHALNSIHKSCKLQNNCANFKIIHSNVMDWANVTKIHTPPSAKRYFPPDEHALYKDNFATGNCELSKVIADIAQGDGNVLFLFHEINVCDANCLFAINAQCLKKTRTLRNGQPVKTLHTASLVTGAL